MTHHHCKHFTTGEASIEDNQSFRYLGTNTPHHRIAPTPEKAPSVWRSYTSPQAHQIDDRNETLIDVSLLIPEVGEKMEAPLRFTRLYCLRIIVNIHPVGKVTHNPYDELDSDCIGIPFQAEKEVHSYIPFKKWGCFMKGYLLFCFLSSKFLKIVQTLVEPSSQYLTYFDEAWKQIIEQFFPQFIRFFVPELHQEIDFQKRVTFLDKEMEQLGQKALTGAKVVDKLAQVSLKAGGEQWILVHIEVQGDADQDFSLRMFRYFYRIFDRYGKEIVSIAVLTERASGPADGGMSRKYLAAVSSSTTFRST